MERREVLSTTVPSEFGGAGREAVEVAAQGATAAEGDEVVAVSPTARRAASRALRGSSHEVRPLTALRRPGVGGVIVSEADLRRGRLMAVLARAYAGGTTIALADATPAAAERLRARLGHPAPANLPDDAGRAALVAFRRVQGEPISKFSVDLLPWASTAAARPGTPGPGGEPRLAEVLPLTASWLDRVFDASPEVPSGPDLGAQPNLVTITSAYEYSTIGTDPEGDQTQIIDQIWNARAFDLRQDFYYVLQEVDYSTGVAQAAGLLLDSFNEVDQLTPFPAQVTLIQPSPQTTQATETVTSGTNYTIGATVGYNEAQGFNVSVTASMSVSNSKTVSVPPVAVLNNSQLGEARPIWIYTMTDPQGAGTTLSFFNQWIWSVPFAAYGPGETHFTLHSRAAQIDFQEAVAEMRPAVPLPFGDVFAIQPPAVTGVSPRQVRRGDTFSISGTGLYPSLVTSVVVGGQPLSPEQYTVVSDTEIRAVAPDIRGSNRPVVVQTTQGLSNDNVGITIR